MPWNAGGGTQPAENLFYRTIETENSSVEISCQSAFSGDSWQILATVLTRVSTVSPVSQADVGLLFWRFSGGGGFAYDQLEAPRGSDVCFNAASSSHLDDPRSASYAWF